MPNREQQIAFAGVAAVAAAAADGDDGEGVVVAGRGSELILEETVVKGSAEGYGLVVKDLAKVKVEAAKFNSNKLGGVLIEKDGQMMVIGEQEQCMLQSVVRK